MADADFRIYPLDDVAVLDITSDDPALTSLAVTAHLTPTDETPLAIDIHGRCRILLTIEQADALCALVMRAKGDAILAALRAGASKAVH